MPSNEAAQCGSLTCLLITIVSRTMSSIDGKSGRPWRQIINLWCQKQCDAIYETERGARVRPLSDRRYSFGPTVLPSSSPALLHFLTSLVFGRTKRDGEEDGKMERLSVINFDVSIKNARASTCLSLSGFCEKNRYLYKSRPQKANEKNK